VELDALELPILDGSAQRFIEMLDEAGLRRLRKPRRYLRVARPLEFSDRDRRIGIYPCDEFRVKCVIDFPHRLIGHQTTELIVTAESFRRELASARTFGFVEEVERLRAQGLVRGGSLDNAIVLTRHGVMNPEGLRFPDEFARHKTLDLIGDLALLGLPLQASVVAHKAGHALHTQLVMRLLSDPSLWVKTTDSSSAADHAASGRQSASVLQASS
jgi:UDP-3-O-[3-hydroxymyristoyl] N-acetylglucosamine deacetylase